MSSSKKKKSRRPVRKYKTDSGQTDRSRYIHDAIKEEKGNPNAKSLAKELGVSLPVLRRDIAAMVRRGFPIAYDSVNHRLIYTEPDVDFAGFELSEAEIVALCFSAQFLRLLHGSAHAGPFASAHAKLVAALQKKTTIDLSKLSDYISFSSAGQERNPDPVVARVIRHAMMLQREITFLYHKPDGSEPKRRTVQPHHTRQIDGLCYLICHDVSKGDLTSYTQKRMTEVERTGEKFERRYTHDDIYNEFRHSLGIFSGKSAETVRLRFTGYAAKYVPLKTWHESEQFTENADRSVELSMQLSINAEVTRFVLQWGCEVEVLGPPSLIASIDAHTEKQWERLCARRKQAAATVATA